MSLTRHEMFLADRPHTIQLDIFDSSGDPIELDGNCTYEIIDSSGGTVDSGVATDAAATGVYTIDDIVADDPDLWTITWSGFLGGTAWSTETFAEPVGSILFDEAQFRTFNDDQFASGTRYTDEQILAARDAVTEQLERWTGRSWVERHCRLETAGSGDWVLPLAGGYARTSSGHNMYRPGRLQDVARVQATTIGSASVSTSSITVVGGHLHRGTTWTLPTVNDPLNVTVEYVYGLPHVVDGADRIAMMLAADRLRETVLSNRATTWSDELGTYRFETPGRAGNVSTIPEVNEWVKAHRSPLLSV